MMGKPVLRGTRITIEQISESLSSGYAIDEILSSHPHLTREQIEAAHLYTTAGN